MDQAKRREYILGAVILVFGVVYLVMASRLELPQRQYVYVDAAFIPYVLGIIMCVLGVLQLQAARKTIKKESSEGKDPVDYMTVGKTVGMIIAYVALMPSLGFPLMTVLYLVAQFTVLTPHDKKINYLLYFVIAIISSAVIYLTFRYAFDMMLPVGLFDF